MGSVQSWKRKRRSVANSASESFDLKLITLGLSPMDPNRTGEMLKHLDKENELLMDAYRSLSHELHRLQVEEEMLMRKYYELMVAQGLVAKKDEILLEPNKANAEDGALVKVSSEEQR